MTESPDPDEIARSTLAQTVGKKAARRIEAGRDPAPGIWFGLGMMGLIGWSVTVPALLGLALGMWLDQRYPSAHAWTLALFMAVSSIRLANRLIAGVRSCPIQGCRSSGRQRQSWSGTRSACRCRPASRSSIR